MIVIKGFFMKTVAILPARLGSSRLKEKMLIDILGKPLIQHTYENAKKCSILDSIFIATDDERISQTAQGFKAPVIMTSQNPKNGTERIVEALYKIPELKKSEYIVNIQGDCPCIQSQTIEKTLEILESDSSAVMSTAVTIVSSKEAISPNTVKCVMDINHNALYFSRSLIPYFRNTQALDQVYNHLGLYIYRTSFLLKYKDLKPSHLQEAEDLEQLKILENGYKIKVALVQETPIGVDVKEDVKKVEEYLCR
jgi:3-deoxy-manno-octulosonate cytidylyltransferase (CMP-KDO synthetase)